MFPRIHRNGTSAKELAEQYENAAHEITNAIRALGNAGPNARNYYPIGDHAFNAAQKEHSTHMEALRSAHAYIEALWEHCADSVAA